MSAIRPRCDGCGLHPELATFRILYRMDDEERVVTVVRVEHRADVYRSR